MRFYLSQAQAILVEYRISTLLLPSLPRTKSSMLPCVQRILDVPGYAIVVAFRPPERGPLLHIIYVRGYARSTRGNGFNGTPYGEVTSMSLD
jgi:hypothetical protein